MKVKFQKIVLLLLVCLLVVHAKEYMKVANFYHMWGPFRDGVINTFDLSSVAGRNEKEISDSTRSQLDYLQKLGYTHVIYRLYDPEYEGQWSRTSTTPWLYNNGVHDRGRTVDFLAYFKQEAERRGLKVIPAIPNLTHQKGIIKCEFNTNKNLSGTYEIPITNQTVPGPGSGIPLLPANDKHANPFFTGCGRPPVDNLGNIVSGSYNDASLEFFEEFVKIIDSVWHPSFPEYIDLGFDELGQKQNNILEIGTKPGFPVNDPIEQVEIIVNYMEKVMEIASTEVSNNVKFLLWGDSFIPGDWGERYEWDHPVNGVLAELKRRGTYFDRTILSQWEYTALNGNYEPDNENEPNGNTNPLTHYKVEITQFFKDLGYKYILIGGESWNPVDKHAPRGDHNKNEKIEKIYNFYSEAQCMYEWIEAGLKDDNCIGFASATWKTAASMAHVDSQVVLDARWINNQKGETVIQNHIAPLIPYLLNNQHLFLNRANRKSAHTWYSEDVLQGCRFVKARQEGEWKKGVHYVEGFAFAKLGSEGLESMSDLNRYRATWNPELTEFTINGIANDFWPNSESGLYAFTTRDDNFVFNAKIEKMNRIGKSGLYLRSEFEGGAKVIYLEYNYFDNQISVLYGDENVRSFATLPTVISNADHNENVSLQIRRIGPQVILSATSRNQTTHLGTLPFPEGEIYVGLVSVCGDGNVTFSDISIERPIDMTPINMLLLD